MIGMGHRRPGLTAVELVEDAAAVHRIARLLVVDSIFEPLRDRWVRFSYWWAGRAVPREQPFKELAEVAMEDPDHPKLVELAACVHCVGVWAAACVLILRRVPGGRWLIRMLAASGLHTAWSEITG